MEKMDDKRSRIDLEVLSRQLKSIDESNISELVALKKSLERSLSLSTEPSIPWIAARNLTRAQVFSNFGLTNTTTTGEGGIDFLPFEPSEFDSSRSEWLARSLNIGLDIFKKKRTDTTLIVNLIIMDVIHDLPGFQVLEQFKSGNTPTEYRTADTSQSDGSWPPPKRLKIRAYSDIALSSTIEIAGKSTTVVGKLNAGFSMSRLLRYSETHSKHFVDTYLVVLNISLASWTRRGNAGMDDDIDELSAYLAMMHHARAHWLDSVRCVGEDHTAYGLVTDGNIFRFIYLDKSMKIHRSPILQIGLHLLDILKYFRHCFTGIINSPPVVPIPEG